MSNSINWAEETLQIFCLLKNSFISREHLQRLQNTALPLKSSLKITGFRKRGLLKVMIDKGILKTHLTLTWYCSEFSEVSYFTHKKRNSGKSELTFFF
jgi:hypothetical protein